MDNNKSVKIKFLENLSLVIILFVIIANAIITKDSYIAVISSICGITYTFLAGKGLPLCYLFGVTGSSFYCILSYQNALWGNLLLYALYYLPMQILGYFRWNKNLKECKKEIVKISLPKKEMVILLVLLLFLLIFTVKILIFYNDKHPYLDALTSVVSIGGMYLTVRRAIEQWIFWMVVNTLSLVMWLNVLVQGTKVYSTVLMWAVYLMLAFYFYASWKKELKSIK